MKIYIKNMVCPRCITAVQNEAKKLGLEPARTDLGEIELENTNLTPENIARFEKALQTIGFERIDERKKRLIEKVKNLVLQNLNHPAEQTKTNWSKIIADNVHYEYNYISNLFSAMEGITIEHYIIKQRVEKIKELLTYDELDLNEIATKLGYSSTSYLINQFKKITGMTTTQFRKRQDQKRTSIDDL